MYLLSFIYHNAFNILIDTVYLEENFNRIDNNIRSSFFQFLNSKKSGFEHSVTFIFSRALCWRWNQQTSSLSKTVAHYIILFNTE